METPIVELQLPALCNVGVNVLPSGEGGLGGVPPKLPRMGQLLFAVAFVSSCKQVKRDFIVVRYLYQRYYIRRSRASLIVAVSLLCYVNYVCELFLCQTSLFSQLPEHFLHLCHNITSIIIPFFGLNCQCCTKIRITFRYILQLQFITKRYIIKSWGKYYKHEKGKREIKNERKVCNDFQKQKA